MTCKSLVRDGWAQMAHVLLIYRLDDEIHMQHDVRADDYRVDWKALGCQSEGTLVSLSMKEWPFRQQGWGIQMDFIQAVSRAFPRIVDPAGPGS